MDTMLSAVGLRKTFTYHASHAVLQDTVLRRPMRANRKEVRVLDGATLELRRGEWVGIYGPNGVGKTTLLRILGDLLPADEGSVQRGGTLSLFLGLGTGFDLELAAEKNIYLEGLLHGMTRAEIQTHTDRIVAFAGLEEHRHMPLKYFSTGMLLRLAYAATAHVEADIYLFDEVLAVGDAAFQEKCIQHLHSLRVAGKSMLLVSHDLRRLQSLCDRIETIVDGRIVPFVSPIPSPAAAAPGVLRDEGAV